jgi:transcriptional regulator of arginine metabolism
MEMNKSYRHGQIMKLIDQKHINTQEQLARELARTGIKTTQVTLSRDIRELGLVKTASGYQQVEPDSSGPDLGTIAGEFLRDIRTAQNILVLRTSPGNANSLAVSLDGAGWPEVVGTIAGDDTVMVVAPDTETALAIRDKLLRYL